MLGVPALHDKPGVPGRYPSRGWETARCRVWTVIFKTASAPASRHILRSPFPSFPPKEQSRCSIPPFERCKATRRSLLEHLVDRSTTLLCSLSHGFGLIFCATALLFASLSPGSDSPLHRLLVIPIRSSCLLLVANPTRFVWCCPPSPCAAFICSCEDKGTGQAIHRH